MCAPRPLPALCRAWARTAQAQRWSDWTPRATGWCARTLPRHAPPPAFPHPESAQRALLPACNTPARSYPARPVVLHAGSSLHLPGAHAPAAPRSCHPCDCPAAVSRGGSRRARRRRPARPWYPQSGDSPARVCDRRGMGPLWPRSAVTVDGRRPHCVSVRTHARQRQWLWSSSPSSHGGRAALPRRGPVNRPSRSPSSEAYLQNAVRAAATCAAHNQWWHVAASVYGAGVLGSHAGSREGNRRRTPTSLPPPPCVPLGRVPAAALACTAPRMAGQQARRRPGSRRSRSAANPRPVPTAGYPRARGTGSAVGGVGGGRRHAGAREIPLWPWRWQWWWLTSDRRRRWYAGAACIRRCPTFCRLSASQRGPSLRAADQDLRCEAWKRTSKPPSPPCLSLVRAPVSGSPGTGCCRRHCRRSSGATAARYWQQLDTQRTTTAVATTGTPSSLRPPQWAACLAPLYPRVGGAHPPPREAALCLCPPHQATRNGGAVWSGRCGQAAIPNGRAGRVHELHTVVTVVLWLAQERMDTQGGAGRWTSRSRGGTKPFRSTDQRQVKPTVGVAECAGVHRCPGRTSDWSIEKITRDLSLTARQWLCTGGAPSDQLGALPPCCVPSAWCDRPRSIAHHDLRRCSRPQPSSPSCGSCAPSCPPEPVTMSGIWAKYNLRLAEKPLQTKTLTVRLILLSLFFLFFWSAHAVLDCCSGVLLCCGGVNRGALPLVCAFVSSSSAGWWRPVDSRFV